MKKKTWALIVADILIFGTIFVLSKAIIPPLNAISYLWLRSVIGMIPYLLWFSTKKSRKRREFHQFIEYAKRKPGELLLYTLVFYIGTLLLVFFAMPLTTAGNVAILNSFSTTLTVLVRYIVYHKRESPRVLQSVVISTIGIMLVIYPWSFSQNDTLKGDLIILLAMVLAAFAGIYNDRISKEIDPKLISFAITIIPAIVLIPFLWIDNQVEVIRNLTYVQWIIITWLGIGISGLGYAIVSYIYSDPDMSAEKFGVMNGLVFIIGVVLGILIYHDKMLPINILGVIIVFIAVVYVKDQPSAFLEENTREKEDSLRDVHMTQ